MLSRNCQWVRRKRTRTWYPKNEDSCFLVDGMAVKWREVLEFWGRCAGSEMRVTRSHTGPPKQTSALAKWRTVLRSSWLARKLLLGIVKSTFWQAFLWSSSSWTTAEAHRDKMASWSARMVANVIATRRLFSLPPPPPSHPPLSPPPSLTHPHTTPVVRTVQRWMVLRRGRFFWSPRWPTVVGHRGLGGCQGRREFTPR